MKKNKMTEELSMTPQQEHPHIYKTCPLCNHLHKAKHETDYYCDSWCKKIMMKILDRHRRNTLDSWILRVKTKQ